MLESLQGRGVRREFVISQRSGNMTSYNSRKQWS